MTRAGRGLRREASIVAGFSIDLPAQIARRLNLERQSIQQGSHLKRLIQPGMLLLLSWTAGACIAQTNPPPDTERRDALAMEQEGRTAEAAAAWRTYLKAHPSNPEPYAHLGLLEAQQGHYKLAIPLYRKALAINPSVVGVRLNLGLALFKGGDLKGAIPEFGAVLKSQPENQQATTLAGMAYYGLGQYKEAVPYLRDAARHSPQSLPLRLALAHSCLWSKQYQCVMDTYHEILALNADSAEADMLAGEALDEMKDNAGAVALFRAASQANPKEPGVHFGLGYLLWAQKKYPEAAQEFQAELANDPNHVQSVEYLADSDVQMNQMDAAKPLLEKVVKINPALPLVHLDLGIVYTEADRKLDALRELSAAAKLDPKDVDVHWRLGRLYRSMGRKDEAKAEFDRASELNKAHDDENFKRIAEGNAKHGDAPPGTPAPAVPPNQ
jgi:tetratricopeptide (TPR) repeat protein